MRLLLILVFLTTSTGAYAHAGTDYADTAAGQLHYLFALHHLPALTLLVIAGLVAYRLAAGKRNRR